MRETKSKPQTKKTKQHVTWHKCVALFNMGYIIKEMQEIAIRREILKLEIQEADTREGGVKDIDQPRKLRVQQSPSFFISSFFPFLHFSLSLLFFALGNGEWHAQHYLECIPGSVVMSMEGLCSPYRTLGMKSRFANYKEICLIPVFEPQSISFWNRLP